MRFADRMQRCRVGYAFNEDADDCATPAVAGSWQMIMADMKTHAFSFVKHDTSSLFIIFYLYAWTYYFIHAFEFEVCNAMQCEFII